MNMKSITTLIVMLLIALMLSCASRQGKYVDYYSEMFKYYNNRAFDHFPEDIFIQEYGFSLLQIRWYSHLMNALEEPSIYQQKNNDICKVFRFTWLRSFHKPIAVRLVVNNDSTGVMYIKKSDGRGGYSSGELIINNIKELVEVKTLNFLYLLENRHFWELPIHDPEDLLGRDGAQWIVEGLWEGKYHIVDRWSPIDGPVRDLGLYLLFLSELDIYEGDIY
ncbi:MAG: hypothetical protein GY839_15390 [candidate division Zixibacteria bacterium]|nr:hypothetical protein [candidate division Zixibacteria bacterium]